MKVLSKEGDELQVLALPGEPFFRGEYLKIEDSLQETSMIVQVYDSSYLDSPGVQEDLLRDELFSSSLIRQDPLQLESLGRMIKDARILLCKVRCICQKQRKNERFRAGYLAGVTVSYQGVSMDELYSLMNSRGERAIRIGKSIAGEEFFHQG
jgi:hypothetical protein